MSSGRKVYLNGNFVEESEAKISIFDSALMFGDMVFEMTRSFNKKQFKLREHLERLFLGLKILHINIDLKIEDLESICHETIEINEKVFSKTDEHRLMINISRGPLGIYAPVFGGVIEPTIIVADFPLKWTLSGMSSLYETGINAVIPSQRAIPSHLMDPKIKNRSRLFYQMANIEVSKHAGDNNWALLLDTDGYITEGTGDNFFIVKDEKIYTPEGRNILRGISRNYIFELAKEKGIDCIEKNIEPYDVYDADEAFMTGTPFCLLPTTSLNGVDIGEGKMGNISNQLLEAWSKNVGLDIKSQIIEYEKETSILKDKGPSPYKF
mgnify:CR=1 FL=1|tara:strand:- start:2074 stop:3045 length:972 start_codon:yes stop_codon:yes gene_type:complete